MSMRRAVVGCLVLACLVGLLAERAEGHITFFSPKELMLMKEREGRKNMEPRSEDGQFEEVTVQQLPLLEHGGNPDKIVEVAVRLSPKQLDHGSPVLEEIIHDIEEELQKAK
ncbi:motilin-like [Pungitius pungitius]|uniref:motilin-like n=1 Tax=Pungitius pungitius TaxID=134920 RepID=UPI0018896B96|nr:motilin-like [Pungitius pungitius]XP_037346472.1 motilin-like [Pungitius pungitius]XP_037346473.1 motilin-like [Pungitius pungitius]